MKKYYDNKLEIYYMLLKKELEKCEDLLAEANMESLANPTPNIGADIDEFYDLDDFVLEVNMYNKEDIYEENNNEEGVEKGMMEQIIEELGYDSEQFKDQIIINDLSLYYDGYMWDVKDDIIMNILDNDYHDNVIKAIQLINELEEKFGTDCEYLYYAIKFRNNFLDDCECREGGEE